MRRRSAGKLALTRFLVPPRAQRLTAAWQMLGEITESWNAILNMRKRQVMKRLSHLIIDAASHALQLLQQTINFIMIIGSALMIWKGLMVVTGSESPIVVVLRCISCRRAIILLLFQWKHGTGVLQRRLAVLVAGF